jgi:flagellar protein FlaF
MSENHKPPQNNPYATAASAYDTNAQKHTPDQREMEARILLKANKAFKEVQNNWDDISAEDLDDTLKYNRNVWMMFVDTAVEDESPDRPQNLRNNIANLGVFIFNHTLDILADPQPEKLNILMEINSEIAAGLMTRPKTEGQKEQTPQSEVPPQNMPKEDIMS